MNKREFLACSVGAVVGAAALAGPEAAAAATATPADDAAPGRPWRLPDLNEARGAATFSAYVGESFAVLDEPGTTLRLAAVRPVARCRSTEQFSVVFAADGATRPPHAGLRTLRHASGQRLALHLEPSATGFEAHFNLLA